MTLSRDELIVIADRYHRTNWDGFDPTTAVLDLGRLIGHITLQAERLAALEAAARAVIAGLIDDTRGDEGYPESGLYCRCCDEWIEADGHEHDCPIPAMVMVLDGDA